jgi:hypothetical protein
MPSETSAESNTGGKGALANPAWLFPKLLVWFGASTGALTGICTVFGYLVEHAYLDHLGVTRTAYEATSREYVITGAKFLAGLLPLSAIGSVLFALHCWWVIVLAGVFAAAAWKNRLSTAIRLLAAAALYGAWLIAMALRFETAISPDQDGLAIFTFGTLAVLLYCSFELFRAAQTAEKSGMRDFILRLPLFGLVFCSVYALPILKGVNGTKREYPFVEFLGKDRDYFCQLAGAESQAVDPSCGLWQLIESGKERALLRKAPDTRIYVVPASAMKTFRFRDGQR